MTNDEAIERVARFLEPDIMRHTGEAWEWRQSQERRYAKRLLDETGLTAIIEAIGSLPVEEE